MKLETFFEKFEQFADAPNAVVKMRELVLQLAVSGKLVEQNLAEGDADGLLKEIAMIKATIGRVKQSGGVENQITGNDCWHEVPESWRWVRLGDVGEIVGGGTPRSDNATYFAEDGIPWLTPADLNGYKAKRISRGRRCITPLGLANSSAQLLPAGSVLFSSRAPIGYVAIAATELATNQGFKSCVPFILETNEYLYYFLMSAATRIDGEASGTTFREVSGKIVNQIPVPLPPLAEQKRIVAKVDELMALCDLLEAHQQERDTRHAALARASLARFAEAPTPANLDFLFHQTYTITPADLRKSILTLAVQGKLVPQDPNDESASSSLRAEGVNLGRWAVAGVEQRFETPESWVWMRFASVGEQRLGKMLDAHKNRGEPKPYLRNTNVQWMRFELDDVKEMRVEKREEAELRLQRGDLLICEGGEPGRCAIWNDQESEMYFQKALHRVRPCAVILSEFLVLNLQIDCQNDVLATFFTGATIKHLTGRSLSQYPVPIPPLAEQRRIVAKVDQLMALVDQLENQLAEAKVRSAALLEAIVHELLNPSAEVIDLASYRAAIGCYTIRKMSQQPYFGRTAAMKTLYLTEAHVGLKLGFQPEREAAGPFDHWIYRFEEEGKQKAWFKAVENASNGKMKVEYQPGKMLAAQAALAESQLAQEQREEFDRLLDLLSGKKTEEVEIIATLFAAWNDFLIDGHAPSDDEIVTEVRENWHAKKERFTPAQLRQWLGWLRKNNLVPQGRLPHTVHQSRLSLN